MQKIRSSVWRKQTVRQRNCLVSFKVKMPGNILFFHKIDFKVAFTHIKILANCLDAAGPYQNS